MGGRQGGNGVVVAAVAVTWLIAAPGAEGASFVDVTLEDLSRASDVIVLGRVVAVEAEPEGPGGLPGIHTRVTVAAEDYLRGEPASAVTFWVHGGRLGNRMRVVSGQARFEAGESVLVFLTDVGGGRLFPTGMSRGKWAWTGDRLVPPAAPCGVVQGTHRCEPGPLSLDELRARVRAAVRP